MSLLWNYFHYGVNYYPFTIKLANEIEEFDIGIGGKQENQLGAM